MRRTSPLCSTISPADKPSGVGSGATPAGIAAPEAGCVCMGIVHSRRSASTELSSRVLTILLQAISAVSDPDEEHSHSKHACFGGGLLLHHHSPVSTPHTPHSRLHSFEFN